MGTSAPSRLGVPGDQEGLLMRGPSARVSDTGRPQEPLGAAAITTAACSISWGSGLAMWIEKRQAVVVNTAEQRSDLEGSRFSSEILSSVLMAGDKGTRPLPHGAPRWARWGRTVACPRGSAAAGGGWLPGRRPRSSLRGAAETLKGFPVDAGGRLVPLGLGRTFPRQVCSQKEDWDCGPPRVASPKGLLYPLHWTPPASLQPHQLPPHPGHSPDPQVIWSQDDRFQQPTAPWLMGQVLSPGMPWRNANQDGAFPALTSRAQHPGNLGVLMEQLYVQDAAALGPGW